MKRESRERQGRCHECGRHHRLVCTHPVTKCLCGERVRLSLVEKRGCNKCGGTGWREAPSHSVERSQFGVGPVGLYVCPCRRKPDAEHRDPISGAPIPRIDIVDDRPANPRGEPR